MSNQRCIAIAALIFFVLCGYGKTIAEHPDYKIKALYKKLSLDKINE